MSYRPLNIQKKKTNGGMKKERNRRKGRMNMNEYTVYLVKGNKLTEMKHSEDVGPASLTLDPQCPF